MDTVKVRELPVKSGPLSLTDLLIVEDNDGTKTTEVRQFRSLLQQSIYFNTVEDMKSATLNEGDVVQTLGFREINDGGGALYKIVYAPTDLDDGMTIHYLHTSDTLRAHLITDGRLNVLQCGAFGDGVSDDYSIITKAMGKNIPLYFPKRIYKISGPLELKSNTIFDMDGATLFNPNSSCICLGLDKGINNVIIRNCDFRGKYGVELYPHANGITIENCTFGEAVTTAADMVNMQKAIIIAGCHSIYIKNNTILFVEVCGISITSGTKNKVSVGNANIDITGNSIFSLKYGINCTSTITDRAITITDNNIKGTTSDMNTPYQNTVGIQLSNNCISLLVSSANILQFETAIQIAGVVDINAGFTDIVVDNCKYMYSILSDSAVVTLSGTQHISEYEKPYVYAIGEDASDGPYIFKRMTGSLILNTSFVQESSAYQAEVSLAGQLEDMSIPYAHRITVTNKAELVNSDIKACIIPGYMNIAIDCDFDGTIDDISFPSLNGQLIALYSSAGTAVLKHNSNILCGKDITLNQYTPVILSNQNGIWKRVA